jgi:hypothetical protein
MSNLVHRVVRSADEKLLSAVYQDLDKSCTCLSRALSLLYTTPYSPEVTVEVRVAHEYVMAALLKMEEEVEEGERNEQ